jgi:hypothetical protein
VRPFSGGKGTAKGGKHFPESRYATVAVIHDGERSGQSLARDFNYKSLLQAVTSNGFPDGTVARIYMYWRVKTAYKYLTAVYAELVEMLNTKCDAYIGPSFMGYLPAMDRIYGFPCIQTTDSPKNPPHIQLADRFWFTARLQLFQDKNSGIDEVITTLTYHYGDAAKYAIGHPMVVPDKQREALVASGCGYDMVTIRVSYAIFMGAPLLSFVHYMYSLMFHTPDDRRIIFLEAPEIRPYIRDT